MRNNAIIQVSQPINRKLIHIADATEICPEPTMLVEGIDSFFYSNISLEAAACLPTRYSCIYAIAKSLM